MMHIIKIISILSFICFLNIYVVDARVSPIVSIVIESPPPTSGRIIVNKQGITEILGLVGEPVIMECQVFNRDPSFEVQWMYNDMHSQSNEILNHNLQPSDSSKYKVGQGRQKNAIRLEISSLDFLYQGKFTCNVFIFDDMTPVFETRILTVYDIPRIIQHQSSYDITVKEGSNTTLMCNASGVPTPTIYWHRNGGSSSIIRGQGREVLGTTINFNAVRSSDRGSYVCYVQNVVGATTWTVKLQVTFDPVVTSNQNYQITQKVGCAAQLLCVIEANPPVTQADVSWSFSGPSTSSGFGAQTLSANSRISMYFMKAADYTAYYWLTFSTVSASDYGNYYCSAINKEKATTVTIQLLESSTAQVDLHGTLCGTGVNILVSTNILLLCTLFYLMHFVI